MKFLRELNNLTERSISTRPTKRVAIYHDWEGLLNDGINPFDVEIEYMAQDLGKQYHPYGMSVAEENLGTAVELLSAKSVGPVEMTADDGETVVKTFKAGTNVEDLPGWKNEMWKVFEQFVQDEE